MSGNAAKRMLRTTIASLSACSEACLARMSSGKSASHGSGFRATKNIRHPRTTIPDVKSRWVLARVRQTSSFLADAGWHSRIPIVASSLPYRLPCMGRQCHEKRELDCDHQLQNYGKLLLKAQNQHEPDERKPRPPRAAQALNAAREYKKLP